MNIYERKTVFLHKMHCLISFGVNCLILFLLIAIYESAYKDLFLIFIVFVVYCGVVSLRVSLDISRGDSSIIFQYLCVLFASCILVYELYVKTTLALTMILVIAIIIEFLMIFVIIYRYKIRNKIIKIFKKKRSK